MRKKIIIGNWKMNGTNTETKDLLASIKEKITTDKIDVVICPSFVSLVTASDILQKDNISIGAQDVFYVETGPYTGEISVNMLKDIGVKFCIVGHSERRKLFNETTKNINKKINILLENNITPILCIGEDIKARENNTYMEIIENEVRNCIDDIDIKNIKDIIIAYEPIWAVGTCKNASFEEAQETCSFIRHIVTKLYGEQVAKDIRIVYGGSVNKNITKSFLDCNDIDGLLVGAASLKPEFINIVTIAEKGVEKKVL